MNEWIVVTTVAALASFIIAIVKPIVSLTKAISELTTAVGQLKIDVKEQRDQAKESHTKLWSHNAKQDDRITDLEQRVGVIEAVGKD